MVSDSLNLGLYMFICYNVHAGNQTLVLYRESKCMSFLITRAMLIRTPDYSLRLCVCIIILSKF